MTRKSRRSGSGARSAVAIVGLVWSFSKHPLPTILVVVNLLILIFYRETFVTVFPISILVAVIYAAARKRRIPVQLKDNTIASAKEDRQAIINKYFGRLRRDSFPYYVENQTRDCIREIMTTEGISGSPGSREYL